uniref:sensor histidine kinase n=1 Tax=Agathobacter sp. TaxID=2021311 RepID=UPI00405789D3
MRHSKQIIKDFLISIAIIGGCYCLNLLGQFVFKSSTLVPMIFVLGVFLISYQTDGYFWGITASLVSVIAVNYTFTLPYYALDFITTQYVFSAVVMLAVAVMTSALTKQIRYQEKIKAESEQERMRANLLRAVSHDLRTPLTSIYGASSVIMENYDSLKKEQQLKLLSEIHEDAQWLVRMVENLLSVTRIDGGQVQVVKASTVLEELIDAVLVKFRKYHPNQEIKVEIPEEFVSIPMDAMLIEQVLINILENAVYHAKGMTELSLKVEIEAKEAVFSVLDNGCGIAPEYLGKIFSGYSGNENVPTDGSRNNMGIGLSVCATIVKAHGSRIYAENRVQGGAKFYFALKLDEENEEELLDS